MSSDKSLVLKICGMHCVSCAMNIDFDLEDIDGVTATRTDYVKQTTVVKYDPKKVTHEKIITVISKLGYEAIVTN